MGVLSLAICAFAVYRVRDLGFEGLGGIAWAVTLVNLLTLFVTFAPRHRYRVFDFWSGIQLVTGTAGLALILNSFRG